MSKIQVNTIELDYEDKGTGDALLLLHGLGSTKKDWDAQVPFFSKTHRVITLDLRGHGNSSKPKDNYGVELMADDVKQFLDQLNIKKVTLVGFSMGGAVAFEIATRYPQYLENLVIVNSGPDFNAMGKIGDDLLKNRTEFLETKGIEPLAKEISFNMFPENHQIDLRENGGGDGPDVEPSPLKTLNYNTNMSPRCGCVTSARHASPVASSRSISGRRAGRHSDRDTPRDAQSAGW